MSTVNKLSISTKKYAKILMIDFYKQVHSRHDFLKCFSEKLDKNS